MPLPFDNMQASLALTQFIPLSGIFPGNNQDPHADLGGIPLGSIRTFAGNFAPGDMVFNGSAQAEGQILQISQNTALFALLGNMYRGNGTSTFALPDLDGRTMIGAGQLGVASRPAIGSNETRLVNAQLPSSLGGSLQPFDDYQSSLPVTYLIRTAAFFPPSVAARVASISSARSCRSQAGSCPTASCKRTVRNCRSPSTRNCSTS